MANTTAKHNLKKHKSVIEKAFDAMFSKIPEEEDYDELEDCLLPISHSSASDLKADHECKEGMTELNGYFICKHCGTNLRKIK